MIKCHGTILRESTMLRDYIAPKSQARIGIYRRSLSFISPPPRMWNAYHSFPNASVVGAARRHARGFDCLLAYRVETLKMPKMPI
jgi:hypothetical protein